MFVVAGPLLDAGVVVVVGGAVIPAPEAAFANNLAPPPKMLVGRFILASLDADVAGGRVTVAAGEEACC